MMRLPWFDYRAPQSVSEAARILGIDPAVEAFDQLFIGDDGLRDFGADAADDDAMHVQSVRGPGVTGFDVGAEMARRNPCRI